MAGGKGRKEVVQHNDDDEDTLVEYRYRPISIMDQVEDLEEYRPGGLAPVTLGDILGNGRFEVIYKLGHGGIATVWLCWELATEAWRAIKINSASHSSENCGDLKAVRLIKEGLDANQLEAGHVLMPLETFWEETPNGKHLCSVMQVLGPRVHDWRTDDIGLDADRLNRICYQITKGLSFIHDKGICHGDFRPQNILMRLKPNSLDTLSRDDMWNMLGEPDAEDVWTLDGKRSEHAPMFVVTAAPWQRFWPVVTDEIAIVDFGEAYTPEHHPTRFGIPMKYASPEILFANKSSGFASDIWSLGISLLELRLDNYIEDHPHTVLRIMERYIGPIPSQYRSEASRLLEADDWMWETPDEGDKEKSEPTEENEIRPLVAPVDQPIDSQEKRECKVEGFPDRLEAKLASEQRYYGEEVDPEDPTGETQRVCLKFYHLTHEEVHELGSLLHQMLRYDTSERISASTALEHPWFRKHHKTDAHKTEESSNTIHNVTPTALLILVQIPNRAGH
ncbi:kinase-like protein [Nemania abortiva]|nr:kinase-like protein [Nemania abortiva]